MPVRARAELTDKSEQNIEEKLKGFQTTIRMRIQALNNNVLEFTFSETEEYRLSLENSQQRLADAEKAERLYAAAGPAGEKKAKEYRASAARAREDIKETEKALKTIAKLEAAADKAKIDKEQDKKIAEQGKKLSPKERATLKAELAKWRSDDDAESKAKLERIYKHRTNLVREVLDKIKSDTSSLTPEEKVVFLEKLVTTFDPDSRILGQLDLKQAYGPGWGPTEFQARFGSRVIDVLAELGTKEAWAAIALISDKGRSGAARLTAVQHLLAGPTAEKTKGIQSVTSSGPNLDSVKNLQAIAPHKFSADASYVDMTTGAVVKYDPANKDFKAKDAKQRFLPVTPVAPFNEALEVSTPVNRWSWLPGKLRNLIKPPPPPEPVVKTAAPAEEQLEPLVAGTTGRTVGEQPTALPNPTEWRNFEHAVGTERAQELVTFLMAYLHVRQIASVPPESAPTVRGRPEPNYGRPQNERSSYAKDCGFTQLGRYNHRGQR